MRPYLELPIGMLRTALPWTYSTRTFIWPNLVFRRFSRSFFHLALALAVMSGGLLGATHFHFPPSLTALDAQSVSSCGCPGHDQNIPADENRSPASDDCHYCKLLSQLSANSPVNADFCFSGLVRFQANLSLTEVPVVEARAYWSRGPPAVQS